MATAFIVGVIVLTACSSPAPEASAGQRHTSPPPAPAKREIFEIGGVTPPQLMVRGGQIAPQILRVPYSIPDPATVTNATLILYVGELGPVVTRTVTPEAAGVAHFAIEPRAHSLGAHVRFRASCPGGTTGWYSLGQVPLSYEARMADVFQISSVTPTSIPWSPAMDPSQSAAGHRVMIFGPKLTPECRIEAQANGSPIELNNVYHHDRQFEGLLLNRDIGYTPVAPRFAELKLVITRASGQRVQAVQRVPFEGS